MSEELCCSQRIFDEIQNRMFQGIDTIIFFHGFNNTFKEAITEAATLKRLYEKEGDCDYTMIVFSWPSDGRFFSYNRDKLDIRKSRRILGSGLYQMSRFLKKLCQLKHNKNIISDIFKNEDLNKKNNKIKCGRLHIMAHSMGNYALRYTLKEFYVKREFSQLFDEVLLIAADADEDAFEHNHKLRLLPKLAKRVTVYFHKGDKLLIGSDQRWLTGNMPRLGLVGPSQPHNIPSNVFLIDCTKVVSIFPDPKEHSYHKTEPAVRRDISHVLRDWRSRNIPGRVYPKNSYYLTEEDTAVAQTDEHIEEYVSQLNPDDAQIV